MHCLKGLNPRAAFSSSRTGSDSRSLDSGNASYSQVLADLKRGRIDLVSYILWVIFDGFLNFIIWRLNS